MKRITLLDMIIMILFIALIAMTIANVYYLATGNDDPMGGRVSTETATVLFVGETGTLLDVNGELHSVKDKIDAPEGARILVTIDNMGTDDYAIDDIVSLR